MTNGSSTTMRAAVMARYGGPEVVQLAEVPRPAPKAGEILVRVHATTVSAGDARVRGLRVPKGLALPMRLALGWRVPKQPILGTELSGVVCALGAGVGRWREGDAVVAFPGAAMGAHAEYVALPAGGKVVAKPASLSFGDAAALGFGGLTAMHYLVHEAKVAKGERVLIIGASGAVGTAAVQLARHLGAHVTGVSSAANAALVRGLGAAEVIDYQREDFRARGELWDVIVDCAGTTSYGACRRVLAPRGRLVRVSAELPGLLAAPLQGRLHGHRVIAGVAAERVEDLQAIVDLAASGAVRAVVDQTLPFARIAEAHARVDSQRKKGSVVVTVAEA